LNTETMEIKIMEHDKKIEEHDKRLDKVEQNEVEFRTEIKNLCDSLKSLTSTMRWFMALFGTTLLGYFIYSIEKTIFK